jgi:hypothetical protein
MDTSNLVTSTLTRQVPYNSYSLNFDGASNEYIDCGYTALTAISGGSSTLSTPMTISMWFKLGSSSTSRGLINFGDLNNNYGGFSIRHESNTLSFIRATQHIVTGGYTFTDTTSWHNMILIYDPSNSSNCYLYIDGSDTGVTFNSNVGNIDFLNSNGTQRKLIIGAYYGLSETFTGKINNVSIFNKELTPTEVLKVYNSGVPSDLSSFNPSPIAWWSLGSDSYFNGNDWICPDLVGSNNGTSDGMDANALIGDAPNSTGNGTSTNMAIDANLTGNAPNSSNNSFSVNMGEVDRTTGISTVSITTAGTGYLSGDFISTTGGSGTGCIVNINAVNGVGGIANISIYKGGSGYVVGDVLNVSGGGSNATITVSSLSVPG